MENLVEIWQKLATKYSNNSSLAKALWQEIEKNYSATKRHYHNLTHLSYMVDLAAKHQGNITDPDTILFSIFYHDIVYNVMRKDNEQQSAEVAWERLVQLKVPSDQIAKCQTQIQATKAHRESSDTDTNYLVDFDLAILGERPTIYQEYAGKIRKEYSIYPDFLYDRGRKKVLQHFVAMDRIFKTDIFYKSHEKVARYNLETELQRLN